MNKAATTAMTGVAVAMAAGTAAYMLSGHGKNSTGKKGMCWTAWNISCIERGGRLSAAKGSLLYMFGAAGAVPLQKERRASD